MLAQDIPTVKVNDIVQSFGKGTHLWSLFGAVSCFFLCLDKGQCRNTYLVNRPTGQFLLLFIGSVYIDCIQPCTGIQGYMILGGTTNTWEK